MSKDDLIYDLIFSQKTYYEINILQYVEHEIYMVDFVDDIREILKKSKVDIVASTIERDKKAIWKLTVRK